MGELTYPLGRGINFSIEVDEIDQLYDRVVQNHILFYRDLMVSRYQANEALIEQREFLIQDLSGYLLRFMD